MLTRGVERAASRSVSSYVNIHPSTRLTACKGHVRLGQIMSSRRLAHICLSEFVYVSFCLLAHVSLPPIWISKVNWGRVENRQLWEFDLQRTLRNGLIGALFGPLVRKQGVGK